MRDHITGGRHMLIIVIAAILWIPAHGAAEAPGFILGFDLHSSHIGAEEKTETSPDNSVFVDETGGGINFIIGYAFTPNFFVRANLGAAGHETNRDDVDVGYGSGTIEAGYVFREKEKVRPFIYGGAGGFLLDSRHDDWNYQTTGPGVAFGGGIFWFLTPNNALDFGARLEFMDWEETTAETKVGNSTVTVATPVDEEGSSAKFHLGWSYWF